jgi:hypothetical protein
MHVTIGYILTRNLKHEFQLADSITPRERKKMKNNFGRYRCIREVNN